MAVKQAPWNHNIHYHRVILDAVPAGCARALDVGCGEGLLTAELSRSCGSVTGIDLDQPSISEARQYETKDGIDFVLGDFLSYPFEPASFDLIASVAALHHMDMDVALTRMEQLLRPGGVLAVVGLARSDGPTDLVRDLSAVVAHRVLKARKGYWEHSAPIVWPPPESYGSVQQIAGKVLPNVNYRRHLLWRYSLIWTKAPPD